MRSLSPLLGLIPVLGLTELGLHQYFASRAPDADDYAALAPELVKRKQLGVPVVVAPAWAEPLLRRAAPQVFPMNELGRPDERAFASFLEVSLLGASAPELAEFPVQRAEQVGEFRLSWRQNPRPEPARFDFVAALERGEVAVSSELDGRRRSCSLVQRSRGSTGGLHGHVAYPRARFECDGAGLVGVTISEDQAYRPHRCVLVQLPEDGSIVLGFDSVPASARLVGFSGFSYFLERAAAADSVELRLSEAGQPLGQARAAGARGWSRFEVERGATPGKVEIRVLGLSRTNSDFCFALEAR